MSKHHNNIIHCQFGCSEATSPVYSAERQENYREDWRRFYVIQLHIYLSGKRSGRIGTDAEGDMIRDLLSVYWEEIISSGYLDEMDVMEKIRFFSQVEVDFPFIDVPTPEGFIAFDG